MKKTLVNRLQQITEQNLADIEQAKDMKFIFVCPIQNQPFESGDFKIDENRGVTTDQAGNKTLDATVVLTEPCPFCGRKHVYHASELSCPFGGQE
jgi:hypothetical protein